MGSRAVRDPGGGGGGCGAETEKKKKKSCERNGKKKRFLITTAAADAVWLRSRLLLLFGVFIFLVACTALSPDDFCFFSSFLIFSFSVE